MAELKFSKGYAIDPDGRFTIKDPKPLNEGKRNLEGEVYVGYDKKLKRDVAIKFLKPSALKAHKRLLDDYENQVDAMCNMKHQYVVDIIDHGSAIDEKDQQTYYIVMEYIENGGKYKSDVTYPLETVLEWGAQLATALEALHTNEPLSIIHRDVKPDNIFIVSDEKPVHAKLADFGLVRFYHEGHPSELDLCSVFGNPYFAAPEQYKRKEIGRWVDTYSLAKSLHFYFTGRLGEALEPLSHEFLLPKNAAEARFLKILEKATHKDPEKRYQTAESLKDDLLNLQENLRELIAKQVGDVEDGPQPGDGGGKGGGEVIPPTSGGEGPPVKPDEKPEPPKPEPPKPVKLPSSGRGRSAFLGILVILAVVSVFVYVVDQNIVKPGRIIEVGQREIQEIVLRIEQAQEDATRAQLEEWTADTDWQAILEWDEQEDITDNPDLGFYVGLAQARTGNLSEGIPTMRRAVEASPSVEKWLLLADAAGRFGERDLMNEAFRHVLELNPYHVEARAILSRNGGLEEE